MKKFDWVEIKKAMDIAVVLVTFIKADGTEREMECTLAEYLLPETTQEASNHTEGETCIVFDIVAGGWRSFRKDRVTKVEIL